MVHAKECSATYSIRITSKVSPGAGGHPAGPGPVGLAEQHGQAGPLVSLVAGVAHDGAVVEAAPGKDVGPGVLHLGEGRALGGCEIFQNGVQKLRLGWNACKYLFVFSEGKYTDPVSIQDA